MNTFKKATKRITAVAASAALVSSAVFGAGLSNYPTNFVDDGEFEGTVVIGSEADSAAATSIISDLASDLSGDSEMVKITAKMTSTSTGGDIVNALDDKKTVNFGNNDLTNFVEILDDEATDLLVDGDLNGDDYTQELVMGNNFEFNHKVFSGSENDDSVTGLYIADGKTYATYTLGFDSALDQDNGDIDQDYKGETLNIMGNEFTVLEIADDAITMVGGANKVSLGEGESSTVTIDGVSYEVGVQSVATDKVLVTINGESKSVDSDEVETVAGVTIGITEIVDSSRDSVKGYATLVIGGQKIELTNSNSGLKINDEKFSDIEMYDDFKVEATFTQVNSKETITVKYIVDENTLLSEGDSLTDVLFGAFTLSFDGTNDVEYSELKLTSTNDGVAFIGNLYDGKEIPSDFELSTDNLNDAHLFLGSDNERIFFKGSDLTTTGAAQEVDGTVLSGVTITGTTVVFDSDLSGNDIEGLKFFTLEDDDKEDMKLYEITSVADDSTTPADTEYSFDELISSDSLDDIKVADIAGDLEESGNFAITNDDDITLATATLADPQLYLENEMIMDFTNIEDDSLTTSSGASSFTLEYNAEDIEADDKTAADALTYTVSIDRATDVDDALKLSVVDNGGALDFSEITEGSDFELFADVYGTIFTIETEDKDVLTIAIPDEEVFGKASFNFGAAGSKVETYTVDAAMADAKVAELEEAGYSVTTEDVSSEEVSFDISAPVMASEVSGMSDMIVVGGPAVNSVAVSLLGEGVVGVTEGEAVVRYFAESNSVLVYGYDAAGTVAAANKLNAGGLSGDEVNVQ